MSEPEPTQRDEGVVEVLERLRAGVRQRQAELACLDEQRGELPAFLAAVRRDAVLEEASFRIEGAGTIRIFVERAVYALFARRQHRALLRQQNRFNRSVELALGELHARQEALGRSLRQVSEQLGGLAAVTDTEPPSEPGVSASRAAGRGAGGLTRMRVAVCATQVPFVSGGAEAMAESLHRELLARGFESALVTVPFAWVPRLEIVESALAWRLLSLDGPAGEPDLVIATRFPSYLIRHPNKVIWLVHQFRQVYDLSGTAWSDFGPDPRDRRVADLVRSMDARAFAEARALYAISGNVAERARRHNGVEAAVLYPPPRLFDRIQPGAPGDYVFTAGRLDDLKRVELLIESLSLTETPVRCRIAGEGPLREALADAVRRHGLEHRVELLGRVTDDEMVNLYRDCLAVYYAPYDEDFGFVTVEAFKAAKPILTAADSGAVLELVRHDENGRIHSGADPAAFARSLDLLWRERERAAELGRRGLEAVLGLGWDRVIATLTGGTGVAAAPAGSA